LLNGKNMKKVVIRKIDKQGRIVIPKKWRNMFGTNNFILVLSDNKIEIYPKTSNLLKFINSVEIEELPEDWHELKSKVINSLDEN
jgi:AbrB family looped-hinge helix DNA binding protein